MQVACEQYLLYFVQFLKDLGVDATASLTHDAGSVLFAVTPTDGRHALERIREALDLYLNLPSSPGTDALVPNALPEVQILQANIAHLKSQLLLHSAAIQLKDTKIEQQRMRIERVREYISGEIASRSAEVLPPSESATLDRVELLDGIVTLTPYKGKGVDINYPELFHRLRKFFFPTDPSA